MDLYKDKTDKEKLELDMMIYGSSFEVNGKWVDIKKVRFNPKKECFVIFQGDKQIETEGILKMSYGQ
jgi:hypothetical protein